jgi:hypothetical protein
MAQILKDPGYWGIDNDYGVLRDVLLGRPDYYAP